MKILRNLIDVLESPSLTSDNIFQIIKKLIEDEVQSYGDHLTVYELSEKCNNPEYKLSNGYILEKLQEVGFIKDGNLMPGVKDKFLSVVTVIHNGEWIDFMINDSGKSINNESDTREKIGELNLND